MIDALAVPDVPEDEVLLLMALRWDQNGDRFADDLISEVAEDSLRTLVPARYDAIEVLAYYRVITGLHDSGVPPRLLPTLAQCGFGVLQLRERLSERLAGLNVLGFRRIEKQLRQLVVLFEHREHVRFNGQRGMSFGPVVRGAHEGKKGRKELERAVANRAPHGFTGTFPPERLEKHDCQGVEQIVFRLRAGRRNVLRPLVAFETRERRLECVGIRQTTP